MSDITQGADAPVAPSGVNKFYFAAWRWHFYAGLFVIPFLIMLVLTGLYMMVYTKASNELGYVADVAVAEKSLPVSTQAKAALEALPGGAFGTYISPEGPARPAFFEIGKDGAWFAVAVDPYTGKVLNVNNEGETTRALAERIHGTILLGTTGDRLVEAAASLAVMMVVTGLYLWWPRGRSLGSALAPRLTAKGRAFWKELHSVTGAWGSVFLLLFLVSGLAWSGVWGDKFVKPWSTFPAEKWDNVPLSDLTHADLDHGILHEVPWGLEMTPLPASGSEAGTPAVPQPVTLDSVVQWAAANGFAGQYKVGVPGSEDGVYTVSFDGRNEDSAFPTNDRFVHIDRYSGNILADVGFAQYKPVGKLMALGIALHKGTAGWASFAFNLVYLAGVLFLCVSGIVLWWKRRPEGALRLAAPPLPSDVPFYKGALLVALFVALAFPLAGVAIVVVMAVDVLVLSWVPGLRRAFS